MKIYGPDNEPLTIEEVAELPGDSAPMSASDRISSFDWSTLNEAKAARIVAILDEPEEELPASPSESMAR